MPWSMFMITESHNWICKCQNHWITWLTSNGRQLVWITLGMLIFSKAISTLPLANNSKKYSLHHWLQCLPSIIQTKTIINLAMVLGTNLIIPSTIQPSPCGCEVQSNGQKFQTFSKKKKKIKIKIVIAIFDFNMKNAFIGSINKPTIGSLNSYDSPCDGKNILSFFSFGALKL